MSTDKKQEEVAGSSLARLGSCQICQEAEAKYTCPGCELSTCSLSCVNQHKKQFKCDGIRSKTKYVPVKNMGELHLLSDYRLLESLDRCVNACGREPNRKITRSGAPLPKHLQQFRKAVSQRGSRIYFMPKSFSRHKDNSTLVDWDTNKIAWRLDVVFLHAQQYKLVVETCSEETVIDVIVEKCLNAAIERKKVYRKHFEAYQASRNDIEVLLKAEKVLESQNRFYVLDRTKSLRENLVGKRIVEYPTLYVSVKGFASVSEVGKATAKSSRKLSSLLLSNYSVDGNDGNESLSSDEDEGKHIKKKPRTEKTTKNTKDGDGDDDVSSADSEDCVGEAFSLLDARGYKDILATMYKSAMGNPTA